MKKVKLALSLGDEEYQKRFINCLMNHYRREFEIHEFSCFEQWEKDEVDDCNLIIMSDLKCEIGLLQLQKERGKPILYLEDLENGEDQKLRAMCQQEKEEVEKSEIYFADKYQEVNKIVDEVLIHVGDEISSIKESGVILQQTRLIGVYSLAENEYQLPFAVTMASILSEKEKVLVLDLQENSGFSQLAQRDDMMGLEEVLVMSESNNFSKARMMSCIGHLDKVDFVYPAENTECLCEAGAVVYLRILQMIIQEMEYQVVIINFGSRFQGFFEVLNHCHEMYLMQGRGGLCQWREYEFIEELKSKGYLAVCERIHQIQIPVISTAATSYERLIEQWKWDELGDMIRKSIQINSGVMKSG